ncbi:MAG: SixA phosphatase family protein [Salibacteraceae bacterium]
MKTIYIARHAKSCWKNIHIHDIDRPLKGNGVARAIEVAEKLSKNKEIIDAIFSSHAIRAYHTALIYAREFDFPIKEIEIRESIYHEDKEAFYSICESLNNSHESVLICGHDPNLTNFLNDFMSIPFEKMQTASVMKITLKTDNWTEVRNSEVLNLVYYNKENIKEIKYGKEGS